MSGDRELDVVVFGATGFVGRLVAGYLAGHAPGGVRIGLAGRSERRLADVRARLGAAASAWPLLVADSADPVSVAALARAARVVVSTVGPYRAQGLALVEACAAAGTDYADLTGEVLFIRDSIDRCHEVAAGTGARIVHCCGFDSVPSDLGALLLHHAARADDAGDLQDTTLVVAALKGGISGGTLASLMGQQEEVRASAERRRVVGDPYALSPDRAAEPDLGDERDLNWVKYDGELRMWVGPFAMAGINTRVVRRSNALQGWAYGRRFRYREVSGFGASPAGAAAGAAVSGALKAAATGLAFGPSRALLGNLLPAPGQGPGEQARRTGYFRIQVHTRTSAGARYLGTIQAQGDPGYAATSVMLGEAALCLALDRDHLPDHAGVLTPATAMGAALAARLRSAGHTLDTRQITQLPVARRHDGLAVHVMELRHGERAARHPRAAADRRQKVDVGTGYGQPQGTFHEELTLVSPGTPSGEFMRRYWQPVTSSSPPRTGAEHVAAVVPGGSAVTPRDPAALADLQLVAARREAIADEVIRLTLTSRTGERLPAWMPGAKRFAPVIDRAVAARGAAFTVELARSHRALHVANGRRESSEVHC